MSAGNTFVYAKASTEGGDLHCFRNDDGTVLLLQNICQVLVPGKKYESILRRLKRDDSITLLACPPNILEQLVHHDLVKPKTRRAVMVNYASVFEILAMYQESSRFAEVTDSINAAYEVAAQKTAAVTKSSDKTEKQKQAPSVGMKNADLPAKIKREKDRLMEWWTSKDTFDRGKYDVISQSSFNTAWRNGPAKVLHFLQQERHGGSAALIQWEDIFEEETIQALLRSPSTKHWSAATKILYVRQYPEAKIGRDLHATEILQCKMNEVATQYVRQQKQEPKVFVETLVAAGEWIAYPQAQKAALGMLKNWRNMPVSTKAEKGRKARAGKRALACLVFTCMNPLRVESWRLMTVHKKLPKDGLRVVIVPVLSEALHEYVRVSGDRKRTITKQREESSSKRTKYLFPSKNGDAMSQSCFRDTVMKAFKKATGIRLCPQRLREICVTHTMSRNDLSAIQRASIARSMMHSEREQKRTYDRRNPDEKAVAGTQVADADIIALMAKQ